MSPCDLHERSPAQPRYSLWIVLMESGQKTASYEGTQLLRGSGSALTAMGTWPASIRGEVRRALPLLNRLDPLHSAAVAAQGHQGTCLGIKSSTVLVVSASVPAARRKRQRGDLVAVSSAGKQGGAVGGQLRLGRHPAACLRSDACRLPCRSACGSSGSKDQGHSTSIAERLRSHVCLNV